MREFCKQCPHPMSRRQMTPRHMVRLGQAIKGYFSSALRLRRHSRPVLLHETLEQVEHFEVTGFFGNLNRCFGAAVGWLCRWCA